MVAHQGPKDLKSDSHPIVLYFACLSQPEVSSLSAATFLLFLNPSSLHPFPPFHSPSFPIVQYARGPT